MLKKWLIKAFFHFTFGFILHYAFVFLVLSQSLSVFRRMFVIIMRRNMAIAYCALRVGYPPKVIWIRRGNCSNRQIELLLRNKVDAIRAFNDDTELSFMQIL